MVMDEFQTMGGKKKKVERERGTRAYRDSKRKSPSINQPVKEWEKDFFFLYFLEKLFWCWLTRTVLYVVLLFFCEKKKMFPTSVFFLSGVGMNARKKEPNQCPGEGRAPFPIQNEMKYISLSLLFPLLNSATTSRLPFRPPTSPLFGSLTQLIAIWYLNLMGF